MSMNMNGNSEHVRIAVTVFDDPERLWGTVLALISNGLSSRQFCLVARESTMACACNAYLQSHQNEDRRHLAALCQRLEDLPGEHGEVGERIVTTGGPLLVSLLGSRARSGDNSSRALNCSFSRHTRDLEYEIKKGLVTLLAKSSDPKQQSIVTRTLLDHSLHRVATCEFAGKSVGTSPSLQH